MNLLLRIAALAGSCVFGAAAAAASPPTSAAKPAAAKPAATKSASTKPTARPAASKTAKKAPVRPVETGPADATPEQIDAADRVYYGVYACEFNQTVDIEKHARHAAYVNVKSGKSAWIMKPVLSSTGAVRLEDIKGETLMVQIATKSMLLNVKTARRIVDDCISVKQRELIEADKVAKANGTAGATAGPALLQAAGTAPDTPPAASPMQEPAVSAPAVAPAVPAVPAAAASPAPAATASAPAATASAPN